MTQKLSVIWESDLGLASPGQMWLIPVGRWCSSGEIRDVIVLINPGGTLKIQQLSLQASEATGASCWLNLEDRALV